MPALDEVLGGVDELEPARRADALALAVEDGVILEGAPDHLLDGRPEQALVLACVLQDLGQQEVEEGAGGQALGLDLLAPIDQLAVPLAAKPGTMGDIDHPAHHRQEVAPAHADGVRQSFQQSWQKSGWI